MSEASRQLAEYLLAHSRCASCDGPIDGRAHLGVFQANGLTVLHLVCHECFESTASPEGMRAHEQRCATQFLEAKGRA